MRFSPELEAKLSKLTPERRAAVEAAGRKLAKASMRKMLDQTAANYQKRQSARRILVANEPASACDPNRRALELTSHTEADLARREKAAMRCVRSTDMPG